MSLESWKTFKKEDFVQVYPMTAKPCIPNYTKENMIPTDESDESETRDGNLLSKQDNVVVQPIACFSRDLYNTAKKYSIGELSLQYHGCWRSYNFA